MFTENDAFIVFSNHLSIYISIFRQPPPNMPPPRHVGPPGPLPRMMGFSQPPITGQNSDRVEDPLMSLRGPPGKAAGSNIPFDRPPPSIDIFPRTGFPPPGNMNQNQAPEKPLDVGPPQKSEPGPQSQFLNFANFPPPPPPMGGQQFGGKENPLLFQPPQGFSRFPESHSNQSSKDVFPGGETGEQSNQSFANNLFSFPPAPGTERMTNPNLHQPQPSKNAPQPPPNFNMLNANFLSSGRFAGPRGALPQQNETKMMNGDLQNNVAALTNLTIQVCIIM